MWYLVILVMTTLGSPLLVTETYYGEGLCTTNRPAIQTDATMWGTWGINVMAECFAVGNATVSSTAKELKGDKPRQAPWGIQGQAVEVKGMTRNGPFFATVPFWDAASATVLSNWLTVGTPSRVQTVYGTTDPGSSVKVTIKPRGYPTSVELQRMPE